jgi:FkbM family methyltransferase
VIWPIYLSEGSLDAATCDLLREIFSSGAGTLIDTGANIGMICIPAKHHTPGIDAYAIEADPGNYECLRMNAYRAGVPDIKILNKAAFRNEGVLDFEHSDDNCGDHRLRANKAGEQEDLCDESKRTLIKVQALPLDTMIPLSGLKSPVVLKVDVQGAEGEVLAGSKKLLGIVDVLVVEFWPYGIKRAGTSIDEFLSLIAVFPYGAHFDARDKNSIRLISIEELIKQLREIYSREQGIQHYDLVLSKKPFHAA